MERNNLNVRISREEDEILTAYAEQTLRSKTDIIRAFIRSLERKLKPGS